MSVRDAILALRRWALESEGSTRPLALMRIGTAFMVWMRFAPDLTLQYQSSPEWVALVAVFHFGVGALFFGLFTGAASVLVALTLIVMVYGMGVGGVRPDWDHHYSRFLCAVVVLMALAPAGRPYSLDRLWAIRASRNNAPERHNLWVVRLIALQVSAVYFWAAFDKSNSGFLSGARLLQVAMYVKLGSASLQDDAFAQALSVGIAWMTLFTEYSLVFGLFFRRTRWIALTLGVLFHSLLAIALPVGSFSGIMWLLYLAFFDPDDVHRLIDRLAAPRPRPA